MPTTTVATTPAVVQLAIYQTDHYGPRVLIGARIDGDPHLFDVPAPGNDGTHYLVGHGWATNDELQAIIADYLTKADASATPQCTDGSDRPDPPDSESRDGPHTPLSLAALAVGIASRASIRELPTDLDIRGSRGHGWRSGTLVGRRWGVLVGGLYFVFDLITG
jgi:hypothetical protein